MRKRMSLRDSVLLSKQFPFDRLSPLARDCHAALRYTPLGTARNDSYQ
jgi:hypothetical protein